MAVTAEGVKKKLEAELKATYVEIIDTSGGCGTMFESVIVSPLFEGITKINQHKLVYLVIKKEFQDIHAFGMKTFTPKDWDLKKEKADSK